MSIPLGVLNGQVSDTFPEPNFELGPENGSDEPRSIWAGIIDAEHGPCSIPAAALADQANEIIGSVEAYKDRLDSILRDDKAARNRQDWSAEHALFRVLDLFRGIYPQFRRVIVAHDICSKDSIAGMSLLKQADSRIGERFAIACNITASEKVIEERTSEKIVETNIFKSKRKDVTKLVTKTQSPTCDFGDPWLADLLVGGRVAVPIAVFDASRSGDCSWVQLGREMSDESFVMGREDENYKGRKILLESLRTLLGNNEITDTEISIINRFIKSERSRQAEGLNNALSLFLTSELNGRLNSGEADNNNPEQVVNALDASFANLAPDGFKRIELTSAGEGFVRIGNLPITFTALQPVNGHEEASIISICAVSRGNVLFPLLELDPNSSVTKLPDCLKNIAPEEVSKYLLAVSSLVDSNALTDFEFMTGSKRPAEYIIRMSKLDEVIPETLQPRDDSQEKLASRFGQLVVGKFYTGIVKNKEVGGTIADIAADIRVVPSTTNTNEFTAEVYARPVYFKDKQERVPGLRFSYKPASVLPETFPIGTWAKELLELMTAIKQKS